MRPRTAAAPATHLPGGAAVAEDASTVWYNPAGMTALPGTTNFAISTQILKPSFKFQNTGSTLPPGTGEGGDGGDWTYIPQGFVTHKLSDKWSIGAALNTPFGLKTQYDAGWRGQAIALTSELKTFNFNRERRLQAQRHVVDRRRRQFPESSS